MGNDRKIPERYSICHGTPQYYQQLLAAISVVRVMNDSLRNGERKMILGTKFGSLG